MEKHIFTSFNAADLKSLVKAAIREVNSENKSKNFQNEIPEDFLRYMYQRILELKRNKEPDQGRDRLARLPACAPRALGPRSLLSDRSVLSGPLAS